METWRVQASELSDGGGRHVGVTSCDLVALHPADHVIEHQREPRIIRVESAGDEPRHPGRDPARDGGVELHFDLVRAHLATRGVALLVSRRELCHHRGGPCAVDVVAQLKPDGVGHLPCSNGFEGHVDDPVPSIEPARCHQHLAQPVDGDVLRASSDLGRSAQGHGTGHRPAAASPSVRSTRDITE